MKHKTNENFAKKEAYELGAFIDDALTEDEALAAQELADESEGTNE